MNKGNIAQGHTVKEANPGLANLFRNIADLHEVSLDASNFVHEAVTSVVGDTNNAVKLPDGKSIPTSLAEHDVAVQLLEDIRIAFLSIKQDIRRLMGE